MRPFGGRCNDTKELRERIRLLLQPFVEARVVSVDDPAVAHDIVTDFESDVQAAFRDLLRKIARISGSANTVVKLRRNDLRRACEFLGLKPPRKGGSIDMDEARKAHRRLSARLHPDKNNGSEDLTGQYIQVQNAWEIISNYAP